MHGSATSGTQWVYRFDGREDKEVRCADVKNGVDIAPCISDWKPSIGTEVDVPSDLLPTLQNDLRDHINILIRLAQVA
jgi:hypothetical protein